MMKDGIVRSPLFYVGDKYKLIGDIRNHFPEGIKRLIEPFAGGGSVFMNTPAGTCMVNDIDTHVISIHRLLYDYRNNEEDFFRAVFDIVEHYGLSLSLREDLIPAELKVAYPKTYLFDIETVKVTVTQSENFLKQWADTFGWDSIKSELNILSGKRESKNLVLKFIPAPVRLEFLTALAIKSRLPDVRVLPNYCCDDTGLPTSTAGGNAGDIECIEQSHGILVEVTMAEGRQQTIMEIWPIERHLIAFKEKYTENSQAVFIAPSLYTDSIRQIQWVKGTDGHVIRPYKISDFISYLETSDKLYSEL